MGVPGLYPWISEIYKDVILKFNFDNSDGKNKDIFNSNLLNFTGGIIDALYIDGNAIIHPIMQFVFNYGEKKRAIEPYSDLSYKEKIDKSFELFFEAIVKIIDMTLPDKIIYLAIDGPAPLAKMAQQRQRRFVSSAKLIDNKKPYIYEIKNNEQNDEKFDPTSITPGTEFMYSLFKFLRYKIRLYLNLKAKPNLKFILSPSTNPGEGEHKILDYIRSIARDSSIKNHVFFGPDGDLIMLTLSAAKIIKPNQIFLLREDDFNDNIPNSYNLLNMSKIEVEMTIKIPVENFILVGFFVGNDFLPKIQMFMYLKDGLNMLVKYAFDLKSNLFYYTGKDININLQNFTKLIGYLKDAEFIEIKKQATANPKDTKFINQTLLSSLRFSNNADGSTFVKSKDFNFEKYRTLYYRKEGDKIIIRTPDIRRMCLEYIKTMNWILKYYMVKVPSWNFCYNYHYPPLMIDLYNTLNSLTSEEVNYINNFPESKPILPFMQLLAVLPKSGSKKLLPQTKEIGKIIDSLPEKYYPEKFEIDYEGKTKEHFGIVLLPFLDIETVEKSYDKYPLSGDLTKSQAPQSGEYQKNTLTGDEYYEYFTSFESEYENKDYGNIKKNKVKIIDL